VCLWYSLTDPQFFKIYVQSNWPDLIPVFVIFLIAVSWCAASGKTDEYILRLTAKSYILTSEPVVSASAVDFRSHISRVEVPPPRLA
jgi:hypothetical protein